MAKTTEVTTVKIATTEIDGYATIMRAMITATNAALKLKDQTLAKKFRELKNDASDRYDNAMTRQLAK